MELIPNEIAAAFGVEGPISAVSLTDGLINTTYKVTCGPKVLVLQKLNEEVFKDISGMMKNIQLVQATIAAQDSYGFPKLLTTQEGRSYASDTNGHAWRAMEYIANTRTINQSNDPKVAFEAGKVIGLFHRHTIGVPLHELEVTMPGFHSVKHRLGQLEDALRHVAKARLRGAENEVDLYRKQAAAMMELDELELPTRLTHNDTKLNNILFDAVDGKAVGLIDLDTIMPGNLHHDFGDAVRTLCNAVSEDESDLSKVRFQQTMFNGFCEGYVNAVGNLLTEEEWGMLVPSTVLLPFLMGVRFLTDFLNGNIYYRTSYSDQNLDRARNQMTLIEQLRRHQSEMMAQLTLCRSRL